MTRARVLAGAAGALALGLLAFGLAPSPIDSRPFEAGPRPALTGPLAPNRALERCRRISEGEIVHSDKLVVDEAGVVYAADEGGTIHRLVPDGTGGYARERLAEMRGRPMELAFAPDGRLVVADHEGPHAVVDAEGRVRRLDTLSDVSQGTAGVAVASDGRLYYGAHTEPRRAQDERTATILGGLAARGASELRVYDPRTGEEHTLATGLYQPVGVALAADESFVAVAEFFAYRVTRHWLAGPRAGETDRLVANLPGLPDGLAPNGRGAFLVTLTAMRTAALDWVHARPGLKDHLAKAIPLLVPIAFASTPGPGVVLVVGEDGRTRRSYHDPDGRVVSQVSTAERHDGHLYLGSIAGDWIARCPVAP